MGAVAAESDKSTCWPCGLIQVHWKQSQKDESSGAKNGWSHKVEILNTEVHEHLDCTVDKCNLYWTHVLLWYAAVGQALHFLRSLLCATLFPEYIRHINLIRLVLTCTVGVWFPLHLPCPALPQDLKLASGWQSCSIFCIVNKFQNLVLALASKLVIVSKNDGSDFVLWCCKLYFVSR